MNESNESFKSETKQSVSKILSGLSQFKVEMKTQISSFASNTMPIVNRNSIENQSRVSFGVNTTHFIPPSSSTVIGGGEISRGSITSITTEPVGNPPSVSDSINNPHISNNSNTNNSSYDCQRDSKKGVMKVLNEREREYCELLPW